MLYPYANLQASCHTGTLHMLIRMFFYIFHIYFVFSNVLIIQKQYQCTICTAVSMQYTPLGMQVIYIDPHQQTLNSILRLP